MATAIAFASGKEKPTVVKVDNDPLRVAEAIGSSAASFQRFDKSDGKPVWINTANVLYFEEAVETTTEPMVAVR